MLELVFDYFYHFSADVVDIASMGWFSLLLAEHISSSRPHSREYTLDLPAHTNL